MKPVKEMTLVLVDFDVIIGPGENEDNITDEMRQKWSEMFSVVENILVDAGFSPEMCTIVRDDNFMDVVSEEEISFEDALAVVRALEESFDIAEFNYCAEGDDVYEENPHVAFCIHAKENK